MVYFPALFARFPYPAIQFAVAGMVAYPALALAPAALASDRNGYSRCTTDLLALEFSEATVAEVCARAFEPEEVSACVVAVAAVPTVDPNQALTACRRDRRPDEVATCVTTIHQDLLVEDSSQVVENCHLSILPERYSQCVVGLGLTTELGTAASLEECIAAGYDPEDITPSFVPSN